MLNNPRINPIRIESRSCTHVLNRVNQKVSLNKTRKRFKQKINPDNPKYIGLADWGLGEKKEDLNFCEHKN